MENLYVQLVRPPVSIPPCAGPARERARARVIHVCLLSGWRDAIVVLMPPNLADALHQVKLTLMIAAIK
jgi:hypothetical protein